MSDYSEMKRLAEAATPTPWERGDGNEVMVSEEGDEAYWSWEQAGPAQIHGSGEQPVRDADFIAAANPAAVLDLIAEYDALNLAIEDLERARIAGFEEYDFTRLKDRKGDQKVFEITIETECGCDVEEGEYTVRITHLLGNWLGSDDFGLISDAVAEVVADLGLPEEGHTTFIAYESGERQDAFWTKWYEIATVASVLAEPGAAIGKGEQA